MCRNAPLSTIHSKKGKNKNYLLPLSSSFVVHKVASHFIGERNILVFGNDSMEHYQAEILSHTTTIPPHRGKYSAQFENYYRKIVILRATKYYPSMNQSIPFFRHHSLYTDTHKRHRRYIMWMSANKFLLVIYFPMAWCCLIFAFHETIRCNTSVSCWAVYQSIQIESDLFFFRFLNSQLDANEKLMFDKQHISKFNFDFTRNSLLFVFGSETKRNIINKRYLYVTVIILFMK